MNAGDKGRSSGRVLVSAGCGQTAQVEEELARQAEELAVLAGILAKERAEHDADRRRFEKTMAGLAERLVAPVDEQPRPLTIADLTLVLLRQASQLINELLRAFLSNAEVSVGERSPTDLLRDIIKDCGLVDADWYLKTYPDVQDAGLDPVDHYAMYGIFEGRAPSPLFRY